MCRSPFMPSCPTSSDKSTRFFRPTRRPNTRAIIAVSYTHLIIFLGVEWANPKTFGPLPIWNKVMASLFQSITPRTAGIATVDYNDLHPITLFITIIFMFIGAGPNLSLIHI